MSTNNVRLYNNSHTIVLWLPSRFLEDSHEVIIYIMQLISLCLSPSEEKLKDIYIRFTQQKCYTQAFLNNRDNILHCMDEGHGHFQEMCP